MFPLTKQNNFFTRHGFTLRHGVILLVVVFAAGGLLWWKQPGLVLAVMRSTEQSIVSETNTTLPRYYAYTHQPQVLGSATVADGTQVINDDGTLSSAATFGDVLGASTETVQSVSREVRVNTFAATPQAVRDYLQEVTAAENNQIDQARFQAALTSQDQQLVEQERLVLVGLEKFLASQVIPDRAVLYHQTKIIQLRAAQALLQSMHDANADPLVVSDQMSLFLGADKTIAGELEQLIIYAKGE